MIINKKLKVINIFAGPGAGKSTTAAELFSMLKKANVKCELVTETAKDLTYDESHYLLQNQMYILAHQYHRLWRLRDKIDVVVTDSPLLLNIAYAKSEYHHIAKQLFAEFDNDNYFLLRTKQYQQYGRNQSEEEAKELDDTIRNILSEYKYQNVDYSTAAMTISKKYIVKEEIPVFRKNL